MVRHTYLKKITYLLRSRDRDRFPRDLELSLDFLDFSYDLDRDRFLCRSPDLDLFRDLDLDLPKFGIMKKKFYAYKVAYNFLKPSVQCCFYLSVLRYLTTYRNCY